MKKLLLGLALTSVFCTTPALANSAQIAVAKKAIYAGEVMPYATPELKKLLTEAHKVDTHLANTIYEPMGCEFDEKWYLGHGQDDLEIRNLKASANNNTVRITFSNGSSYSNLVIFSMKGNQIDNVQHGSSNNPKKPPTKTDSSLRANAKKLIDTYDCY